MSVYLTFENFLNPQKLARSIEKHIRYAKNQYGVNVAMDEVSINEVAAIFHAGLTEEFGKFDDTDAKLLYEEIAALQFKILFIYRDKLLCKFPTYEVEITSEIKVIILLRVYLEGVRNSYKDPSFEVAPNKLLTIARQLIENPDQADDIARILGLDLNPYTLMLDKL